MADSVPYQDELKTELSKLNTNDFAHASRFLAEEMKRVESGDKYRSVSTVELHHDQPSSNAVKVRIPVKEYPAYNFVGKLLGPKGSTLKGMSEATGCKLSILGKGSMRDKNKEEELRKEGGKYAHLNEDLHLMVECFAETVNAYGRISHALSEIKKFLNPKAFEDQGMGQIPGLLNGEELGGPPGPVGQGRGRGGPGPRGGMGGPGRGGLLSTPGSAGPESLVGSRPVGLGAPAGRGAPPPGRGVPRGAPAPRGAPPMRGAPSGRGVPPSGRGGVPVGRGVAGYGGAPAVSRSAPQAPMSSRGGGLLSRGGGRGAAPPPLASRSQPEPLYDDSYGASAGYEETMDYGHGEDQYDTGYGRDTYRDDTGYAAPQSSGDTQLFDYGHGAQGYDDYGREQAPVYERPSAPVSRSMPPARAPRGQYRSHPYDAGKPMSSRY